MAFFTFQIKPTALTFAKLINLFFVETADSSKSGQHISVLLLMRLALIRQDLQMSSSRCCRILEASTHVGAGEGTQHDQKLSGGWRSDAYTIYQRPNFAASDCCAAAMRNPDCIDLNILRYAHSTPDSFPSLFQCKIFSLVPNPNPIPLSM